jgi:pyruvate kinase
MRTDKVAVFTESGLMARRLSSFRSGLLTFALTTSEDARNQLSLIWGVLPLYDKDLSTAERSDIFENKTVTDLLNTDEGDSNSTEEMLKIGERCLLEAKVIDRGETIVVLAGRLSGMGLSSSVIVWTIGERVPKR